MSTKLRSGMSVWRVVMTIALAAACAGVGVSGAGASYPGVNGLLLFDYAGVSYAPGHGPPAGTPKRGLYGIRSDGGGVRLVRASTSSQGAAWSGDGRRIIFVDNHGKPPFTPATISATGRGLRHIALPAVPGMSEPTWPAWSRDGKRIAFVRYGRGIDPSGALFVANADGSHQRRVFSAPRFRVPERPRWSPNGRRIAFSQYAVGVSVINSDGTGRKVLYRSPSTKCSCLWGPDWSPDGTRLVFGLADPGPAGTATPAVVNTDGSGIRRITEVLEMNGNAGMAWSPDGKQIAFSAQASHGSALWVVNADGTNPRQIHRLPPGPAITSLDWQSVH